MKQITILFFLLLPSFLMAQKVTVSGFIEDAQTGEHLYGATIYDLKSKTGAITNSYGFYSITLSTGNINLQVSFVGYQKKLYSFTAKKDTVISFFLTSDNKLQEVVVKADNDFDNSIGNFDRMSMNKVNSLPGFLGENDVLKALTQLPGVQQGKEGSSGIFVRGGSPDQNLILLDGVPIYNATHLWGFTSVFNPEAIQSADLYKGNFPARFGGRLSSVIDVRMKEGNKYKPHTDVTFGILSSKITHEGPIKKGKSSYIISARRTLVDLLITGTAKVADWTSKDEAYIPGLYFYDVNAKFNFTLNPKNHIYFSLYNGGDHLFVKYELVPNSVSSINGNNFSQKDRGKISLKWGNSFFVTGWNRQINSQFFMNSSLSSALYSYGLYSKLEQSVDAFDGDDDSSTKTNIRYFSKINTNLLKLEFDWFPNNQQKIKFGNETSVNLFIPGVQEIEKEGDGSVKSGNKTQFNFSESLFIEDHFQLNDKWRIDAGLRYDLYFPSGKIYQSLSPRLNIDYLRSERANFSFSYARMFQPVHLLSNNYLGVPSDIWVPATANISPEHSSIVSMNANLNLTERLDLKMAAFYKKMKNVTSYESGYSYIDINENWEDLVTQGEGRSWGFENALNYRIGNFEWWANYTLSWNQRRFPTINKGNYFPYRYDRRHDINLGFIWKFAPQLDFSATWIFQTGQAVSISEQSYAGYPDLLENSFDNSIIGLTIDDYDVIESYSGYNNYRLPDFHHLDIGLSRRRKVGNTTRELRLGIYNVYMRQNPYLYYSYTDDDGLRRYKQVCIFPFLPSISYKIIF